MFYGQRLLLAFRWPDFGCFFFLANNGYSLAEGRVERQKLNQTAALLSLGFSRSWPEKKKQPSAGQRKANKSRWPKNIKKTNSIKKKNLKKKKRPSAGQRKANKSRWRKNLKKH